MPDRRATRDDHYREIFGAVDSLDDRRETHSPMSRPEEVTMSEFDHRTKVNAINKAAAAGREAVLRLLGTESRETADAVDRAVRDALMETLPKVPSYTGSGTA